MDGIETKKAALIRIWQIFNKYSDCNHPITQEEIADYLHNEYGIDIDRKTISNNISVLKEIGAEIESGRKGSYLQGRIFENSELHMLMDAVLCSKYITPKQSSDIISRLCLLTSNYFKTNIKNVYSVKERNKTENQAVFLNIELIDEAVERGKKIQYDYNKYGADKKLHKSSSHNVSPYQLVLHNQRYYLMGYSENWDNIFFHRLDRITNMKITDETAIDITTVKGYENGIDYKQLSSARPYMYTDEAELIKFKARLEITDQIIDWFGKDISIKKLNDEMIEVQLEASPRAMEHWAMQYLNYVEIISPENLRENIENNIKNAVEKYGIKC